VRQAGGYQAGLSQYPLYATTGGTLGVEQDFNRLRLTTIGTVDRTAYQDSQLTDGEKTTNDDRNFNQYGGIGRVSYDLLPGPRPFGEIEGDSRVHDTQLTATASTSSRTSPEGGTGIGTSSRRISCGPPNSRKTTAFIDELNAMPYSRNSGGVGIPQMFEVEGPGCHTLGRCGLSSCQGRGSKAPDASSVI